jgi:hypothetical protein
MELIQALECTEYSDARDGFLKFNPFANIRVMEFKKDHLQQKFQWVHRATKIKSIPRRSTWNDNFARMVEHWKHWFWTVYVGPTNPVGPSADIQAESAARSIKSSTATRCDFCYFTVVDQNSIPCRVSNPDDSTCDACLILNRPCTFTLRHEYARLWADQPPLLRGSGPGISHNPSRFPTGPLRDVAFHRRRADVETAIVVRPPRDNDLGLGTGAEDEDNIEDD